MWENAVPKPPENEAEKRNHATPPDEKQSDEKQSDEKQNIPKAVAADTGADLVFWAQLLISLALLAAVLLGRNFSLPYDAALRVALTTMFETDDSEFLLNSERGFVKFTEQAAATLRVPHRQPTTVPSGCRAESYLPPFTLYFPLRGGFALSSGYGARADPMGGQGTDYHTGNDYASAVGTPVYAAADGVVRIARVHASYGNYLRLLHEGGDETLYAHLQYLFVRNGQRVSAGDCLGTVGETGNTTGPHLHFELLHGGVRYDPDEALQKAV